MKIYHDKALTYSLGLYMLILPWDGYFLLGTSMPISPSFIFLAIISALYVLDLLKNRFYEITLYKPLLPLLLILLYATITLMWSPDKMGGIIKLGITWSYLIVAVLILNIVKYKKVNILVILWLYVLGALSVGVFSVIMNGFPTHRLTITEGYNPTWYAAIIVWALVSTVKLFQESKFLMRGIIIIIDIILIVFLILTQGRNAIMAISVSFLILPIIHIVSIRIRDKGFMFAFKKVNPFRILKMFIFIVITASVVVVLIFSQNLNEQLTRVGDITELFGGDSEKATAGRTTIWKDYFIEMDQRNVFGLGVESSGISIGTANAAPHNIYVLMLAEYGVFGFILWLFFLWSIIRHSFNNINSRYTLLLITFITVFMGIGNDLLFYKYWWTGLFIFILIDGVNNLDCKIKRDTKKGMS